MSGAECTALLGVWEGYGVGRTSRREGPSGVVEVWIELVPVAGAARWCSGCGEQVDEVHDRQQRLVRDLPILDAQTWLVLPRHRLRCPRCGPRLERLSWLAPYSRVTRRLAESVVRLCSVLPIRHVAQHFGLGWDAVKAIDKAWLVDRLIPVDLDGVELLVMDEFALHKGHRYATVVADALTKRVLWVGRGHSREAVRPFFELLGPERCRRIKAVGIDMSAAFEQEVRAHCPQALVVYDLFHVVAKYGREVIDAVRVAEANRLRHDKPARRVVKSARWLLLRNEESLKRPEDRARLAELLDANRALLTVYVLKDDLKQLWRLRQPHLARSFWQSWYARALESGIEPLIRFARRLQTYLPGILAHCLFPLHTSLLEGINNRIKVIKRMAYGFRDEDYFFLKIRAAFPGNVG
ncbi:MAG TPA: ISL3 family transposase [Thermoanaerobaculia bacterium]|nr:ISL3 family transposase [Thermoanaerobaculia bacterium]